MKIERKPHTTQWLSIEDLSVLWAQSQRPFDEAWARKIADEFDPDYFGVISVTLPNGDGKYHIIDGQHRAYAARLALGQEQKIPCNVFDAHDPARAAEIFDKINTSRKSPRAIDQFKVRVTAGNPDEVAVNAIIEALGFRVNQAKQPGNIAAVGGCLWVYRRFGAQALENALVLLQMTFGKDPAAVDSAMIRGFAEFLHRFSISTYRRVAERVSRKHNAGQFLGHARTTRQMFGGSVADGVVRMLVEIHNTGLKTGRLNLNSSK